MGSISHLRGYNIHWNGPQGPKRYTRADGLNVLSAHITRALRKAKVVTQPPAQEIEIGFQEDPENLEVYQRHPKTAWLYWRRDYRHMAALDEDLDNRTIGELSISVAKDLQDEIRATPRLINNFPFQAIDEAIDHFRSEDYSVSGRLGRARKIYASPMTARLSLHMTCLKTTVSIGFFLKRKELHQRELISFGGGDFDSANSLGEINVYDGKLSMFCVDMARSAPVILYDDLPDEVRKHLPTNAEIEKAWESGPDPMERF